MKRNYTRQSVILAGRMRRFCFTILTLAAFSVAPAIANANDVVAGMKEYLAAWNEHDATKAANYLAEDVVYFDASVGAPVKGRAEAKKKVIEAFLNAVPDLDWELIGQPVVDNNTVAFEWKFSGTNRGDWSDGTKATNKIFSIKGMSLFRFKGNKIIYQGDYYDALSFYTQLGLM